MKFFDKDSIGVKSAILLFTAGVYTDITDVPDLFNLREVVQEELKKLRG